MRRRIVPVKVTSNASRPSTGAFGNYKPSTGAVFTNAKKPTKKKKGTFFKGVNIREKNYEPSESKEQMLKRRKKAHSRMLKRLTKKAGGEWNAPNISDAAFKDAADRILKPVNPGAAKQATKKKKKRKSSDISPANETFAHTIKKYITKYRNKCDEKGKNFVRPFCRKKPVRKPR